MQINSRSVVEIWNIENIGSTSGGRNRVKAPSFEHVVDLLPE